MEQFITAVDEWYGELVEEQRAATPEVASQLRYVLSHIADARRIVKRLVEEEEQRVVALTVENDDGWAAFVEHVNSKPVKWGNRDEVAELYDKAEEVHGDDAR